MKHWNPDLNKKTLSGSINIRLPFDLLAKIKAKAQSIGQTKSYIIRKILDKYFKEFS